jgi:RHS repeat-associated protein
MATATAYDPAGRAVSVTTNARTTYAPRIISGAAAEGLVGYWPLDERVGTTAGDAIGTRDGSLVGTPRWAAAGAVDEARTAISLDGSSYVSVADHATLDIGGPISIEYWARSDELLDSSLPASTWKGGVYKSGAYGMGWSTHTANGSWRFQIVSGGVNRTVTSGAFSVEPERWYHVVGTYDGDWQRLYVDGVQVGASQIGSVTVDNSSGALRIGQMSTNWVGDLDEVALYDEALTTTEVAQHYAAGRDPSGDARLTTRTTLDGLGRATATTSPRGIVTANQHDALGRVTAVVANQRNGAAASATSDDDVRSTFAYNAVGELLGYCSAVQVQVGGCDPADGGENQAWHYGYDTLGRRVSQIPPLNTSVTPLNAREWIYAPAGRLTSVEDRTDGGGVSRHTDFTYDNLGRALTEQVYLGSDTSNLELAFTSTWNADGTQASRSFDGTAASPAQGTDAWTFTYDALGRPDLVQQGSTTVTDHAWNADGTLASRTDLGAGTSAFSYDWAHRQASVSAPSLFGSGSIGFDYRLDGLLAERSTPNGVSAAVAYDAAKRPVEIDLGASDLSRGYDRDGNVTSEGRSFSGVSGDAGSGTATYTYDGLNRVTGSSGLSRTDSYSYDRNGNRVSASEGSVTTTYAYDRADQLIEQTIGGVDTAFAYNAWGDMTTAADADGSQTTHAYDAGGRMIGLTPSGGSAASYTYDAMGRVATRSVAGASLTYRYVGTGHTTYATVPGTGSATYALIDGAASRLAVDTGGTTAWSVFDAHGNFAGAAAEASATIVNAVRYDAWGSTLDAYAAGSGSTEVPWRFQGRLDVSPDADEPLYDYGARMYRPSGGTFTQLDTYAGTAQNPLSMNRFLYAHANPTTLIDPTGHCVPNCMEIAPGVPIPTLPASNTSTSSPATAVPPLLLEDTMAAIPLQADAHRSVWKFRGAKSWRTPFSTGGYVYVSNPSNLPWVGEPVEDWPAPGEPGRLGMGLAADAAAPPCRPSGCMSPGETASVLLQMPPLLGDLYQLGVILLGHDPIAGYSLTEQQRQEAAVLFASFAGLVPVQFGRQARAGVGQAGSHIESAVEVSARWSPEDGVPVLGRRWDTEVAAEWPGHALVPQPWGMHANEVWIDSIIEQRGVVYLATTPTLPNLRGANPHLNNGWSVFKLELDWLLAAGYQQVGDYMMPPPLP